MAENGLPEKLAEFKLSNVEKTNTKIGAGAYGIVEEVVVAGAICAAKKIHDKLLQDDAQVHAAEIKDRFVTECQLMSTLRHPNIVQFLGVFFFPGSELPALIMERLPTSLHDLLEAQSASAFFPLSLKCSILHNVACGLAYLHEQSPPVIHRDLSAKNVLLTSDMVAKIADLGVARIVPRVGAAATMTQAPGATVYMPPEALENKPGASFQEQGKKAKYDLSIDIFSFGVVAIFAFSQTFPDVLPLTYRDGDELVARTELQRRQPYMDMIHSQLHDKHPLVEMIEKCLDFPEKRPNISELLQLLEQARADTRTEDRQEHEMNKLQLAQALQSKDRELQSKDRELGEVRQQLKYKEEELEQIKSEKQTVTQQLMRENLEMVWAKEVTQRKEQEIQEMKQHEAELVQKLKKAEQHIQGMGQRETQLVQAKDQELDEAQQSLITKASGPGLVSATVNNPTCVLVALIDSSSRPCPLQVNVTGQLKEATLTGPSETRKMCLPVTMKSPSEFEISYTATNRGRHNLHVQINENEINGSPFSVTVYPDISELHHQKRAVPHLNRPCDVAFNTQGHMIVTELHSDMLSVFDSEGKKIKKYAGDMKNPRGIAIDDMDNIYVTSRHKLHKFNSSGKPIKVIGSQKGKKIGEFNDPHGLTIYGSEVYVCDCENHRIQVFNLQLNYLRCFGSRGNKEGEFNAPYDAEFDTAGNMYIVEFGNNRVQVVNTSGHFIREFGQEGERKLCEPSGLLVTDKYVYVSDWGGDCIVVYKTSGQYVDSCGVHGDGEGEFDHPTSVTSCADGFIYVCDTHNDRVQIF